MYCCLSALKIKLFRHHLLVAAVVFSFAILAPERSRADQYDTYHTPRFTLQFGETGGHGGHRHHFHQNILKSSVSELDKTYEELSRIFDFLPQQKVTLKFLSPTEFTKATGAPGWTSAMYYQDEITIPLSPEKGTNITELKRALRHEYVHAVIAEISSYRCPAWLDEGIAQLIEGGANPLLGPALRKWIAANDAMPLNWLQDGFTTLDSDMVPAAYAQSLFATRSLVNSHGFSAVKKYLENLKAGTAEENAFVNAFGRTKPVFEKQLTRQMRLWASSSQPHP